jgi:hypothetical protein
MGEPVTIVELVSESLSAVERDEYTRVRLLLRDTVSGYALDGEIMDWIYQQRLLEPLIDPGP